MKRIATRRLIRIYSTISKWALDKQSDYPSDYCVNFIISFGVLFLFHHATNLDPRGFVIT